MNEQNSYAQCITVGKSISINERCLARFIERANVFRGADIYVEKNGNTVNAKSMLGVLSLAITGGDRIVIIAKGKEKVKAVKSIVRLLKEMEENAAI